MAPVQFSPIEELFRSAAAEGRSVLLEHECYRLLSATGAEAAPDHILIPSDRQPTPADLGLFSKSSPRTSPTRPRRGAYGLSPARSAPSRRPTN